MQTNRQREWGEEVLKAKKAINIFKQSGNLNFVVNYVSAVLDEWIYALDSGSLSERTWVQISVYSIV